MEVKRPIPRFMVTRPSDDDEHGNFIVVDVPWGNGGSRRGLLLFSASEKAREFIAGNMEGEIWQVRFLDYQNLHFWFLKIENRNQFDCAIVDYMNSGNPEFVHGFEIDAAIEAIGRRNTQGEEVRDAGDSIDVDSWSVVM